MAGKRFAYNSSNGAVYLQWSEHTLCKSDISEVHRQRLEIEQRAEDFLRMQSEMTENRLRAINQARFEIARIAWLYDPNFAADIVATIQHSLPGFVPSGAAARFRYRILYRTLGFSAAGNTRTVEANALLSIGFRRSKRNLNSCSFQSSYQHTIGCISCRRPSSPYLLKISRTMKLSLSTMVRRTEHKIILNRRKTR